MDTEELDIKLIFNAPPEPKCLHCGRRRGDHKAGSYACPIGRGNFPQFKTDQHYEPKRVRSNV